MAALTALSTTYGATRPWINTLHQLKRATKVPTRSGKVFGKIYVRPQSGKEATYAVVFYYSPTGARERNGNQERVYSRTGKMIWVNIDGTMQAELTATLWAQDDTAGQRMIRVNLCLTAVSIVTEPFTGIIEIAVPVIGHAHEPFHARRVLRLAA